jgi:hypothetical protein
LLFNETTELFVWLFETFLTAMSGKHPSTIFTDQDVAMAGAIAYVFPNTSYRLCIRSSRKNSKCNNHILVQCYKLRGQYQHSWLHMHSHYEATVVFNAADMTITCACRKYESIGMYTHFNLQNRY